MRADDRRLVARLRAGDETAFDEFARSYVPALYRFTAARMSAQLDLVPDVVQSALAKAIERLDGFRGDAPLFTWLCACCKNELVSHHRRRQRQRTDTGLDFDGVAAEDLLERSAPAEAELRLLDAERRELVHAALDLLVESHARALEWKYFDGESVATIAGRLGTTTKAAESLLTRARVAFRVAFARVGGVDAGRESRP